MKIKQDDPTKHEIHYGRVSVPIYIGESPNIQSATATGYIVVTIDLNRLRTYATRAIHAKTRRAKFMKGAVSIKAEAVDIEPTTVV